MLLVKSVLMGVTATAIAVVGISIAIIVWLSIKSRNLPSGEAYGWDPVTFFRHSMVGWLILVAAFALGFAWEYRRAG